MFNGERLKEARKAKGWSQERLGEVIGVSRSAINKYEKGTVTNLLASQVGDLARSLGVAPGWLAGWTDDPTPVSNETEREMGVYDYQLNDDQEIALLETFRNLDVKRKTKALFYLFSLEEEM